MYRLSVSVRRDMQNRDNQSTKDDDGKAAKKGVEVLIQRSDKLRTELDNLERSTMR